MDGRSLADAVGGAINQSQSADQVTARVIIWIGAGVHGIHGFEPAVECHPAADPVALIFLAPLFLLYSNIKFPFITVLGVVLSAPWVALWPLAHRHAVFVRPASASWPVRRLGIDGGGLYLLCERTSASQWPKHHRAIREGAILRLRPIMMTALVAALGLLPAALATGVGTDTQRPFALVIVAGLLTPPFISIFSLPALYTLVAAARRPVGSVMPVFSRSARPRPQ